MRFAAVCLCLLLVPALADCKDALYRLPKHVWPLDYRLRIHTSHDGYTFKGHLSIDIIVKSRASNITIHSRDLKINHTGIVLEKIDGVYGDNETPAPVTEVESTTLLPTTESDAEEEETTESLSGPAATISGVTRFKDYIVLVLDRNISEGDSYRLNVTFSGKTNAKRFKGYYRVQPGYAEDEWMTGTVFTKDLARRAFPCFDEPQFKARFAISLAHHNSTTTLSNMPLQYSEPVAGEDGWVWDHFESTPLMSTYLIAFHIGKFKAREVMTDSGRPFRVWGPANQLKWANRTLADGPKYVAFFENYTGIEDPMPKQDLVTVPKFYDGLENWGLVSFAQSNLLYPPGGSRLSVRSRTLVVAHEMAHTWFGNLVTHHWWDELWLSEGFATYFAALALQHTEPSWDELTHQVKYHLASTFEMNVSPKAEALSAPVVYPEDMKFSLAPYSKGMSLIRMLHMAVGENAFRNGVTDYLETCSYGTANQKTLFDILTRNAHADGTLPQHAADLNTLMHSWTYRAGLPVLYVNRTYSGQILLSQEKFTLDAGSAEEDDAPDWWIPVTYLHEGDPSVSTTPSLWLDPSDNVTTISDPAAPTQWVVFNTQAAGTYRVLYDEENVRLLVSALNSDDYERIPVLNRVQLLLDYGDFALAGRTPAHLALDAASYLLQREKHGAPWTVALGYVYTLSDLLKHTASGELLQEYGRELVSDEFQRLGMKARKSDTADTMLLREQIILAACRFQHVDCVNRVTRLFRRWMSNPQPDKANPISPDVRFAVYCTALRQGTDKEWKFLWERYVNARNADHRDTIKSALSCTQVPEMIKRFFLLTIGPKSNLTGREQIKILQDVSENEHSMDVLLNIMERLSPFTRNAYGQKFQWYSAVLPKLSHHICDTGRLERLKVLQVRANVTGTAAAALETAVAVAQRNIQWKHRNHDSLRNYFLSRKAIQNENTLVPSLRR